MRINALVVDDEPLARERVRMLLEAEPDIFVRECSGGREAIALLQSESIDLVVLDVQMPEVDGFAVIEALGQRMPTTIFCTAHDVYAVRAFEINALEYVLKPIDEARLQLALTRARDRIAHVHAGDTNEALRALIDDLRSDRHHYVRRLPVKDGDRVVIIRVEEIDWIEATRNYVRLHVGNAKHVLRESMQQLETQLDPESFARVHRSTIVHLDRIRELHPHFHGDYTIVLHNGERLTLSRRYKAQLETRLRHFF